MRFWIWATVALAFSLAGCGGAPDKPPEDVDVEDSSLEFQMPAEPLAPAAAEAEKPTEEGAAAPAAEKEAAPTAESSADKPAATPQDAPEGK